MPDENPGGRTNRLATRHATVQSTFLWDLVVYNSLILTALLLLTVLRHKIRNREPGIVPLLPIAEITKDEAAHIANDSAVTTSFEAVTPPRADIRIFNGDGTPRRRVWTSPDTHLKIQWSSPIKGLVVDSRYVTAEDPFLR